MARYATKTEPETNVTQIEPAIRLKRDGKARGKQNLKAARQEIRALEAANRAMRLELATHRRLTLAMRGLAHGLILGLVIGATATAALAFVLFRA